MQALKVSAGEAWHVVSYIRSSKFFNVFQVFVFSWIFGGISIKKRTILGIFAVMVNLSKNTGKTDTYSFDFLFRMQLKTDELKGMKFNARWMTSINHFLKFLSFWDSFRLSYGHYLQRCRINWARCCRQYQFLRFLSWSYRFFIDACYKV